MADFLDCFKCQRVMALAPQMDGRTCPLCGSTQVEKVSAEEVDKRHKAGVYFDIDSSGHRRKRRT
jgi:D-serine deaminase-like pyridoxal phosphate-dependent protein